MAAKERQMVNMLIDTNLLKRIEDFRFKYRFDNRTDAVRWLLEAALKANLRPEKE